MKIIHYILFVTTLAFVPTPIFSQLTISKSKIDSRELPFTLNQLIDHLEKQLSGVDGPLLIQRKWQTIKAYYSYLAAKREIESLTKIKNNLKAIYHLNLKRQEKADIPDIEVLLSHNKLLNQEITLLRKQEEIRSHLLLLLQFCNVGIESDGKVTQDPDSFGK